MKVAMCVVALLLRRALLGQGGWEGFHGLSALSGICRGFRVPELLIQNDSRKLRGVKLLWRDAVLGSFPECERAKQ